MVIKCTHLRNVARRQTSGISWMGGFLWFRASNDVQLNARVICAHLFGCRRRPKWVIGMSERFFRPGRQFVLLPYLYNQLVECNRTLVRRVRGAIVHFPLLFGAAVLEPFYETWLVPGAAVKAGDSFSGELHSADGPAGWKQPIKTQPVWWTGRSFYFHGLSLPHGRSKCQRRLTLQFSDRCAPECADHDRNCGLLERKTSDECSSFTKLHKRFRR